MLKMLGLTVMSTSPSESIATPFWPGATTSLPAVAMMASTSLASPRFVASSISGMFDSLLAPGPKKDSDWSSVRRSVVPTAPATETESVFVAVAPAHGAGTLPKRSWPAASILSVAWEPGVIVAVTAFVAGL